MSDDGPRVVIATLDMKMFHAARFHMAEAERLLHLISENHPELSIATAAEQAAQMDLRAAERGAQALIRYVGSATPTVDGAV